MSAPNPFFTATTPKRRPLPVVKKGAPQGAPPSVVIQQEEPEDLGPAYPPMTWVPLTTKSMPLDEETPILCYTPGVGMEYMATRACDLRAGYLGRVRQEKVAEYYRYVTHWAYIPRFGEVPF